MQHYLRIWKELIKNVQFYWSDSKFHIFHEDLNFLHFVAKYSKCIIEESKLKDFGRGQIYSCLWVFYYQVQRHHTLLLGKMSMLDFILMIWTVWDAQFTVYFGCFNDVSAIRSYAVTKRSTLVLRLHFMRKTRHQGSWGCRTMLKMEDDQIKKTEEHTNFSILLL